MSRFTRLSDNWLRWTGLARIATVSTATAADDTSASFESDDQSFFLRRDDSSWVLDVVDDRGRRHTNVARFSTLDLAEKYLIWKWASVARSAVGAVQLGRQLHAMGSAPGIVVRPTQREGAVELLHAGDSAIVPRSFETIFSQLISKTVDEVENMVNAGIPQ